MAVTGSDPEVTSFDRKSLESGCRRRISQVLVTLSSYRVVTRRRWQLRHRKGRLVTGSDLEVKSLDRKSLGSGCRRPVSQVLGAFENLQGCNSQEVTVT